MDINFDMNSTNSYDDLPMILHEGSCYTYQMRMCSPRCYGLRHLFGVLSAIRLFSGLFTSYFAYKHTVIERNDTTSITKAHQTRWRPNVAIYTYFDLFSINFTKDHQAIVFSSKEAIRFNECL